MDLNSWLIIHVLLLHFNFTTSVTLRHLLHPCPWIKNLSAKTFKSIPKYWERSAKMKSSLNFVRVIFCWSAFSMVQTLSNSWNISTLSMLVYYMMQIALFSEKFLTYELPGLFSSLTVIMVLNVCGHNFFILKFHCSMLLLNFITSKYSFFRRINRNGTSISRYV